MAIPPGSYRTEPDRATRAKPEAPPTGPPGDTAAVLVVHGMGQQVPNATLSDVVRGIRLVDNGPPAGLQLQTVRIDDIEMAVARTRVHDDEGGSREVHVFEAYWAPLTAEKVSLRACMQWLVRAGRQGVRRSLDKDYRRLIFNERVQSAPRSTLRALVFGISLLVLASLVALNAVTAAVVGALVAKRTDALAPGAWPGAGLLEGLSAALLLLVGAGLLFGLWMLLVKGQVKRARSGSEGAVRRGQWMSRVGMGLFGITLAACVASAIWMGILLAGGRPLPQLAAATPDSVSGTLYGFAALWLLLGYATLRVRRAIVDYVGDVVAYVGMPGPSVLGETRAAIQNHVQAAMRSIYRARTPDGKGFLYDRIVVTGHSLGSVIAYDALNAVIAEDLMQKEKGQVIDRTRMFLTFGSPLDKIAYIFGFHDDDVQELLAVSAQPLILDYKYRRFPWVNVHAKADIVSGRLDLYDLPEGRAPKHRRVENIEDPLALAPLAAHTSYWGNRLVWERIHQALVEDPAPLVRIRRRSDEEAVQIAD
jgi:hypothetical protein